MTSPIRGTFYKLLGFAVWKVAGFAVWRIGARYVSIRYGSSLKRAAGLVAVALAAAAGYALTRDRQPD